MKKKLAILALAGVMLFSGLNVFAATDICPHPTTSIFISEEKEYDRDCYVHDNCKIYTVYEVKKTVCHRCFKTLKYVREYKREIHEQQ